jgi:Domain of unknown function (DUF3846)
MGREGKGCDSVKPIRVAIYRPGQPAKVKRINPTLGMFQGIVGGSIEFLALPGGLAVYCNEMGKLNGLPACRALTHDGILVDLAGLARPAEIADVLVGTFLVFRVAGPTEGSLTDEDLARLGVSP